MQLSPYLYFNGDCAEAVAFYAELLGAEAQIMTYAQMPSDPDMPLLAEADKRKVANSELLKDGKPLFYASDTLPMFCDEDGFKPMQGFQVSIGVHSVAEGKRIFDALSAGGQVQMPFAETFWAKGFGIVTDRFGTPWMVNAELRDE
ncbi:MAG: VOC family protein [Brachymonas sp.]|nr:VOC family protein [Brachymonas sp.]